MVDLLCVLCCWKGLLAAAGKLNAVVVWFDLHLAEGVSLTIRYALWLVCRVCSAVAKDC
jgi:hypothetical protein